MAKRKNKKNQQALKGLVVVIIIAIITILGDKIKLDNINNLVEEVSTNNIEIKEEKNPDIRYYACVVDKNRAGAKPKLLFKINLAYNSWEELGYLKLKQK